MVKLILDIVGVGSMACAMEDSNMERLKGNVHWATRDSSVFHLHQH
jgi:hypothetical protein